MNDKQKKIFDFLNFFIRKSDLEKNKKICYRKLSFKLIEKIFELEENLECKIIEFVESYIDSYICNECFKEFNIEEDEDVIIVKCENGCTNFEINKNSILRSIDKHHPLHFILTCTLANKLTNYELYSDYYYTCDICKKHYLDIGMVGLHSIPKDINQGLTCGYCGGGFCLDHMISNLRFGCQCESCMKKLLSGEINP